MEDRRGGICIPSRSRFILPEREIITGCLPFLLLGNLLLSFRYRRLQTLRFAFCLLDPSKCLLELRLSLGASDVLLTQLGEAILLLLVKLGEAILQILEALHVRLVL